jgi:hypothetical protein
VFYFGVVVGPDKEFEQVIVHKHRFVKDHAVVGTVDRVLHERSGGHVKAKHAVGEEKKEFVSELKI